MTDAEYLFRQTSSERKRIGRGDYNKKRQGGKVIRFPSDGLSRKEKKALNGEVMTYRFYKPITWEEFKKLPNDIRQEYLDMIKEKFGLIPGPLMAESFGVVYSVFTAFLCDNKLTFRNSNGKKVRTKTFLATEDGKAWAKWHKDYRGSSDSERAEIVSEDSKGEAVEEYNGSNGRTIEVVKDEQPIVKVNDVDKIASLISSLVGTGAKLTIEIVL